MQEEIRIAVALVVRDDGDTLLVRRRGTPLFAQSGGRIEGAETPKAALGRALRAELGLAVAPSRMTPFACFETEAADLPDHIVVAHVFRVHLHGEAVAPAAGIEEAIWTPLPEAPALPLAPLTRDHILTLYWQLQFGMDLPDRRDVGTTAA